MIVSMIVAVDENWGIGKGNQIPWYLPTDLRRFKHLTMGHHLIMGRKTYESIGKSLPGRTMIVVTRNQDYQPEYGFVTRSLGEAIQLAHSRGEDEVFIIGGGEIYNQALPFTKRIYLTQVHTAVEVDTNFPKLNLDEWHTSDTEYFPADVSNQYAHSFLVLYRKETQENNIS